MLRDSQCVIEWYRSIEDLKRFVSDKIKEIRSYNVRIGYIKSEENPADIATRGCDISTLMKMKLWWNGPDWLSDNSDEIQL